MIDLVSLGLGVAAIVVTPVGYAFRRHSALIKEVAALKTEFMVHSASDAVVFQNLDTTLADIKNEQRDQTLKLDRLIDRFL
jgi:hypothetical protein